MDEEKDQPFFGRLKELQTNMIIYNTPGTSLNLFESSSFARLLSTHNITLSRDVVTGELSFNTPDSRGANENPIYYVMTPAEELPGVIAASLKALPKAKWVYYLADSQDSEDMITANLEKGVEGKKIGTASHIILIFVPEESADRIEKAPNVPSGKTMVPARSVMERVIKEEIEKRFQD